MLHISDEGPALSLDRKREFVQKMRQIASEIYEIPKDKFMIHILEFQKENTGSGGALLSDKKTG